MSDVDLNDQYDYVILGTGLVECILSSLLSKKGFQILHIDKNSYYGGACSSLSLTQILELTRKSSSKTSVGTTGKQSVSDNILIKDLGPSREYLIDTVPKLLMASGDLARILALTNVTRYLEFRQVEGAFVYRDGAIYKVPASETEAIFSSLFGIFEKRRAYKFFDFIRKSHQENTMEYLKKIPMKTLYDKYGLGQGAQDFIGHALALHSDDIYIQNTAYSTCKAILLYMDSVSRFGKSPFIYPLYGLGDLSQAFARLSAVHGSTYMLNVNISAIKLEDQETKIIMSSDMVDGERTIRCTRGILADPSYFPELVKTDIKIIRALCILPGPVPNTGHVDSLQIIIPQRQVLRSSALSYAHGVCPSPNFLAYISTQKETSGDPWDEIAPALSLLGSILHRVVFISEFSTPLHDCPNNVFISNSYDSSSHFESVCENVKMLYLRITGTSLDYELTSIEESENNKC